MRRQGPARRRVASAPHGAELGRSAVIAMFRLIGTYRVSVVEVVHGSAVDGSDRRQLGYLALTDPNTLRYCGPSITGDVLTARGDVRAPRVRDSVPPVKVRDVIALVKADGWVLVRTKGSHRQYRHPTKAGTVTIAGKPGVEIPPGTLSSVLKQAGLKD